MWSEVVVVASVIWLVGQRKAIAYLRLVDVPVQIWTEHLAGTHRNCRISTA